MTLPLFFLTLIVIVGAILYTRHQKKMMRIRLAEFEKNEAPAIQAVNQIIREARGIGASDIHFEPAGEGIRVSFQANGQRQEKLRLPGQLGRTMIRSLLHRCDRSRFVRREPLEESFTVRRLTRKQIDLDLQFPTTPSSHGELIRIHIQPHPGVP